MTITQITPEGIHVKHGDTVTVAPLPERLSEVEEFGEVELTEAEIAAALAYHPPVDLDALRAQLWKVFDQYARSQTDDNSRVSINLISVNPASTGQQLQRATEWAMWWANLWAVYAAKRAELLESGVFPELDLDAEVGPAPYNIWEIAE